MWCTPYGGLFCCWSKSSNYSPRYRGKFACRWPGFGIGVGSRFSFQPPWASAMVGLREMQIRLRSPRPLVVAIQWPDPHTDRSQSVARHCSGTSAAPLSYPRRCLVRPSPWPQACRYRVQRCIEAGSSNARIQSTAPQTVTMLPKISTYFHHRPLMCIGSKAPHLNACTMPCQQLGHAVFFSTQLQEIARAVDTSNATERFAF
jgi:hypothetical protein